MTAGFFGLVTVVALTTAVGWATGELILSRWPAPRGWGFPERALMAIAGFVLFAVGLMVLHIVTGGAVFGTSWIVPLLAAVVLIVWRHPRSQLPSRTALGAAIGLAAVLLLIYAGPAIAGGSGTRTGDPPWHLGWTNQLLDGEPVPEGPAPELARNAYPWGLHAVMATMVRLVPGSDSLLALEALHVLIALGIPLAAGCLARRLEPRSGWLAAAAAALVGGWGWVRADGPTFVTSPSNARFGADLVVASPNSVYELLPPALPRELGLILLGAAGVAIVIALTGERDRYSIAVAGALAGAAGLVSVPMFVSALMWMLASAVITRDRRPVLRMMAVAIAVFALWVGPVVTSYVRYGGFVDITPQLGKEWPIGIALASWGLLLPLASAGVALAVRHRSQTPSLGLLAFLGGSALLLAFAILRGHFGWELWGNATLLHQGRVWPPAHLAASAFAGITLLWVWRRVRSRTAAVLVVGSILMIGSISPILASMRMTEVIAAADAGFVYGSGDLAPNGFVRLAAATLDSDDIVWVAGDDRLAFLLFEMSGARLARYDDLRLEDNDLRIRYPDLAERWDERMAAGGFEPTHRVIEAGGPAREGTLATGEYGGKTWILIRA
ncbi:MAG TPA: hypothetical protein VNC78_12815 [Actinomycetota bacterium]|nr:hypothetical protein [Actinomycetota bacterium]